MLAIARSVMGVAFTVLTLTGCPNKESTQAGQPVTTPKAPQAASPTPGPDRTVSIASVTPDPSKPLRPGSVVKLIVEVNYVVPSPGGIVGVVIQDPDDKPVKSNLREVASGAGKLISEIDFTVPKARYINVHVPLYVKGENKSSQVAVKQFEISAK